MIKKILVANRGEIACRIIKTAKKMGIATVAVYSEADRSAVHVAMADEAVCIGPAPSGESYLVQGNILRAVRDTGADAVHPGYGFLSENAAFARALAREKVTFIGPKPRAITIMGDKIESRKLAARAGVNTVPGYPEAVANAEEAVRIATGIGYPVMLKASAGGGGKGMRIARNDEECLDGFARAASEARSGFGDDRILIEKFIEEPRHIEIQVLGDAHGTVLYLGERECSIQRRHQKVIEEAPSPFIDPETRAAMGEQAVTLARAVKYQSAGTVEFIVDRDRNFYFLEMNTRLQVEHPVTELVTGLDLVEQMIRIADGQKLNIRQQDVPLNGWAVEARVYAEDPSRNFLPSVGRLVRYTAPDTVPDPDADSDPDSDSVVRVDSGVCEGGEISVYYDPMIAKLVTWGRDRDAAIRAMGRALDAYYIRGVSHNIPFLAALMAHERFIGGRVTTNFIAEEYPDGFHPAHTVHSDPNRLIAAGAVIHHVHQHRAAMISGRLAGRRDGGGDRAEQATAAADWVVIAGDDHHVLTVRFTGEGYAVSAGDRTTAVHTDWAPGNPLFVATIDGADVCMQVECIGVTYRVIHGGSQADLRVVHPATAALDRLMPRKEPPDTSRVLLSPMPGLLVSLAVSEGQDVKSGDVLAVIEAMKMENVMRAEKDCVVQSIDVRVGDSLAVDQVIMAFR